jgi:hypothetical protein
MTRVKSSYTLISSGLPAEVGKIRRAIGGAHFRIVDPVVLIRSCVVVTASIPFVFRHALRMRRGGKIRRSIRLSLYPPGLTRGSPEMAGSSPAMTK